MDNGGAKEFVCRNKKFLRHGTGEDLWRRESSRDSCTTTGVNLSRAFFLRSPSLEGDYSVHA